MNADDTKIRLSTDSRYQPAGDPVDERWIGENPIGHDTRPQPLSHSMEKGAR